MTGVRLVAVGDVSFGDNAVCASFGIESVLGKQPGLDLFEHVRGILAGHDIAFANLETVLSDHGLDRARLRSRHMRGRPGAVRQLADAGINVVSVANNHILQHGRTAFDETLDLLRSNGILPVGVAGSGATSCEPARLHIRGTEVVFLGYAFESDKYFHGVPLYAQADLPEIAEDVRRVKTSDNIVICSFHWGREFVTYPAPDQIRIARGAIDAGCDLILGHHPHVLNGYERYNGGYVFYSLGNFVFDQLWYPECRRSAAVHLTLSPGDIQFAGADSIYIGDDYRPRVIDDGRFADRLDQLCAQVRAGLAAAGGHEAEAARVENRNRYLSWLFLLRHLHRYDRRILRQIVAEAVLRRLTAWRGGVSAAEGVSHS